MSNIRDNSVQGNQVKFNIDKIKVIKTSSGKVLFACTRPIQQPVQTLGYNYDSGTGLSGGYYRWRGSVHISFPEYENNTSEYVQCFSNKKPYEFRLVDAYGNTPTRDTNYIRHDMRNAFTGVTSTSYTTYGEFIDSADTDNLGTYNGAVTVPITEYINTPWSSTLGNDSNVVSRTTSFLLQPVLVYDVTDYYANKGRFWSLDDFDDSDEGGEIIVGPPDIYD